MSSPTRLSRPSFLTGGLALCLASWQVSAHAELASGFESHLLSPSGYTGVINTPSAHVQGLGVANLAWSNNNPEMPQGPQLGNINMGIGLLPGLEAVGRLSYAGDLNCNMYAASCDGRRRDLSISAKYQLPLDLWHQTRAAIGVSDFGGAATNYRQVYGVLTTKLQNTELSIGHSQAHSTQALMHGTFGSVRYALSPSWHLMAEHDTRERRAGTQYAMSLSDRTKLLTTYSRKWTHHTNQQSNQLQLALVFHLDRTTPKPVITSQPVAIDSVSSTAAPISIQVVPAIAALSEAVIRPTEAKQATAQDVAQRLQAQGFANVHVRRWSPQDDRPGLWEIRAEPRAWRQSQIEAMGHALRAWLDLVRQDRIVARDRISVTLTYQREPVLHASAHAACLNRWAQGQVCTSAEHALTISRTPIDEGETTPSMTPPSDSAYASAGASWSPQFTLSPALRNTLGTEYGLVDYSLAAQIGTEIGLAPGLFWQGIYLLPMANSDDYQPGRIFGDGSYAKQQWHSSQLSYWKPLPFGVSAQVSVGQLTPTQYGSQFDALWMSPQGRWRVGLTSARYRNDLSYRRQLPLYSQVRYTMIPNAWHIEATAGQFMNNDRGYKLASVHWFGDTRISMQYQKTAHPILRSMPSRAFMGFAISFPFGPKTAVPLGPVWLRAQDRWNWGLQTKVGERDNYITSGYGEFPRQRQGLWSDVTDHDRNGFIDLQAQLPRLRALLQ